MNIYYILVGFDAKEPFTAKFTFLELATNKGRYKDTEMFYALKELHSDDIVDMKKYDIISVNISRDDKLSKGLFSRVNENIYNETKA